MVVLKVNTETFAPENVIVGSGTQREIPNQKGNYYYKGVISYNYGDGDLPNISDFRFEGPVLHTSRGVVIKEVNFDDKEDKKKDKKKGKGKEEAKEPKKTKFSYSIWSSLSERKAVTDKHGKTTYPERDLKRCFIKIFDVISEKLVPVKGTYSLPKHEIDRPAISTILYTPTDRISGKPTGGDDRIYAKIVPFGIGRTIFKGLDGKEIPLKDLENAEFDYIPTYHVQGITNAGKKQGIDVILLSAVVLPGLRRSDNSNLQSDTIDSYLASNPEALKAYEESMKAYRESLVATAAPAAAPGSEAPVQSLVPEVPAAGGSSLPGVGEAGLIPDDGEGDEGSGSDTESASDGSGSDSDTVSKHKKSQAAKVVALTRGVKKASEKPAAPAPSKGKKH